MKLTNLFGILPLFIITACMCGCDDDADMLFFSGSEPITQTGTCTNLIGSANLYLNGSQTQDIGIANGKGGYSAQSSDESVVSVTVSNNRLVINAHGKEGKVSVTVTDKKGNSKLLPVIVSYGIISFDYFSLESGFNILVNNEFTTDEDLKKQVNEAMNDYPSINEGGKYVLRPTDLANVFEPGENSGGKLSVYLSEKAQPIEGTYTLYWDDTLNGKKQMAFSFNYNSETHVYFLNPSFGDDKTRSNSSYTSTYLVEDVTIHCPSSIVLPENSKVLYGQRVRSFGIQPSINH